MASRLAGVPAITGLGAAAVVAVGACTVLTAPAFGDDSPTPTPTTSPSGSTPAAPTFTLTVSPTQDEAVAGNTLTVTAVVTSSDHTYKGVQVRLTTDGKPASLLTTTCAQGHALTSSHGCDLDGFEGKSASLRQRVSLAPENVKKTTSVTLNVALYNGAKLIDSGTSKLVFDPKPKPTPSSPKPTTSKPADPGKLTEPPASPKPTSSSPTPSPTRSSNGGGGGGDDNTTGNGGGYTPPSTNGSLKNPQVALPPISGNAPSPSVAAPDAAATPQSTLRANKRPVAQEMTFQRVASTQVAWLAALLVACSLLLTQLRLGRRPATSGAASKRPKGTHRRPRNGAHGK
ncbi:hypothetical protein [Actinomadura rupiterrae]|uniref:hypothetical protein n=1 Tax=Actinomadura rupiterrae TaxID=559627 RepID=UPI0020A467A8|nr:hypothetical protein [Actinomadura rupiterrae]MCP2334679.1 hypothetical protein [Actinomadura rupiterrae]